MGLALGIKWGAGVLLAHILDENGHESWSAPVLYKVNEVSLGLLAGETAFSIKLGPASLHLTSVYCTGPLRGRVDFPPSC